MVEKYENFVLTDGVRNRMQGVSSKDLKLLDLMISKIDMNKLYDQLISDLAENKLNFTRDQAKALDSRYKKVITEIERHTGEKVAVGRYIKFKYLVTKKCKI